MTRNRRGQPMGEMNIVQYLKKKSLTKLTIFTTDEDAVTYANEGANEGDIYPTRARSTLIYAEM